MSGDDATAPTTLIICDICDRPVRDKFLKVKGRYVHQACFACARCNINLTGKGYFVHEGLFICKKDMLTIQRTQAMKDGVLPSCQVCKKACYGKYLNIDGKPAHKACFKCVSCDKNLAGQSYFLDAQGDWMCAECYNFIKGKRAIVRQDCPVCDKPMRGGQATAIYNHVKYHADCLTCNQPGCKEPALYNSPSGMWCKLHRPEGPDADSGDEEDIPLPTRQPYTVGPGDKADEPAPPTPRYVSKPNLTPYKKMRMKSLPDPLADLPAAKAASARKRAKSKQKKKKSAKDDEPPVPEMESLTMDSDDEGDMPPPPKA